MSRPVENFYGLVVMDNYDLSNLSFLGECEDSGEYFIRSESSIKESIDLHFQESSRRSDRPTVKRQKLDGSETEFLPLPQGMVTRSQFVAMPEKSADSQKNTEQNPDESFKERVKQRYCEMGYST